MTPMRWIEANRHFAESHAKVVWYSLQYIMAQRFTTLGQAKRRSVSKTIGALRPLLDDLASLIRQDRDNIARGVYKSPVIERPSPVAALAKAARYFADLGVVNERRKKKAFLEVRNKLDVSPNARPAYYLRNFHFQTDGYLSDRSAKLYDHQVEVLFLGGAGAMRRQALAPIAEHLRRRRGSRATLIDVATGTGPLLTELQNNFPTVNVHAIDLSLPYLNQARQAHAHASAITFTQAQAEMLPMPDDSADLVTCIYLMHELPAPVRAQVAAEMARVLRPGGRLVLEDSIQLGDVPEYDTMIENFPNSFHEPFYLDYAKSNMVATLETTGLHYHSTRRAFLSKVMVFDKPESPQPGATQR